MIPYQFPDGVTIDLEALVAVEEIKFINASINEHSDWTYGEYYYELVFKFASQKVRRYPSSLSKTVYWENPESLKRILEAERQQLIEDWKLGLSKCLV